MTSVHHTQQKHHPEIIRGPQHHSDKRGETQEFDQNCRMQEVHRSNNRSIIQFVQVIIHDCIIATNTSLVSIHEDTTRHIEPVQIDG